MSKQSMSFRSLGDRMKMYENIEGMRILIPQIPFIARLDGRSFHRFTKGLQRPYDANFSTCMVETAKYLIEETHCTFAYIQSDEITLGFYFSDPNTKPLFGGRIQKLTSTLAGLATAKFNQQVSLLLPDKAKLLPTFDCRVFSMPSLEEVGNCVLFRVRDCVKNSVSMASALHFSSKQLHKKNTKQKISMLEEKGIFWNEYPDAFKNGTLLRKISSLKNLTEEELQRIPENKRPENNQVMRSTIIPLTTPCLTTVYNLTNVLFYKDSPITFGNPHVDITNV